MACGLPWQPVQEMFPWPLAFLYSVLPVSTCGIDALWQDVHFGSFAHGILEPLAIVDATLAMLPWQVVHFPSVAVCAMLLLQRVDVPGWQS